MSEPSLHSRIWRWLWQDVGVPRWIAIVFYTGAGLKTLDWMIGWFS